MNNLYSADGDGLYDNLIDTLVAGIAGSDASDYSHYSGNMLGWINEILGEKTWEKLEEIVLSVENNTYTAVQSANSVGKTWIAARIVLAWLNIYRDSCKVVTTAAPPERQIKELLWGEIKDAWRKANDKNVPMVGNAPGAMNIRVSPNWWAQGFTIPQTGTREDRIARFQGHHAEHLLFILDEAHGIPPEIYEAMDSCLSGGHNHALILSNPLAPSGPFFEVVKNPKYHVVHVSAFDHPNVRTGRILVPGAVTREKTVERINDWSHPIQSEEEKDASCFQVPEYFGGELGSEWRKVSFPFLDTKTLGRFPSQAVGALCSLAHIQAAADRWQSTPPDIPSVTEAPNIGGLDVAEFGIDSNCFIRRQGSWVSMPKRWNGVDPIQTGSRGIRECKTAGVDLVYVDAIGVGSGVPAHMKTQDIEAVGVKVTERPTVKIKTDEFYRLRDQLLWAIREWLRTDENAMLPPDKMLLQELSILTYDTDFHGKLKVMDKEKIKDLIGRSPDALDAFALTFFVGRQWKSLEFVSV